MSIAGWLGGYGPTTKADWEKNPTKFVDGARMELGLMMWAVGFLFQIFHDEELREIRRSAMRKQKRLAAEADPSTGKGKAGDGKQGVDKVYMIPRNGFFKWTLHPHYFFEWVEWTGFWIMGGSKFVPGRTHVINEIATMLPRALQGRRWYIEKFGKEKIGSRAAVVPGLI
jgi:3-oxo-5-alpha-steroid 4-dehydrogenase 1